MTSAWRLAEVAVTSVTQVASICGGPAALAAGTSKSAATTTAAATRRTCPPRPGTPTPAMRNPLISLYRLKPRPRLLDAADRGRRQPAGAAGAYRRLRCLPWAPRFLPFLAAFPHCALHHRASFRSALAVVGAVDWALARGCPQMSVELTNRPFWPPCISRTNLETGASGTASKVFAEAALDGVDPAGHFGVDLAVQGEDEVGEVVAGGSQVDRAFQGLVEQRGVSRGSWP